MSRHFPTAVPRGLSSFYPPLISSLKQNTSLKKLTRNHKMTIFSDSPVVTVLIILGAFIIIILLYAIVMWCCNGCPSSEETERRTRLADAVDLEALQYVNKPNVHVGNPNASSPAEPDNNTKNGVSHSVVVDGVKNVTEPPPVYRL